VFSQFRKQLYQSENSENRKIRVGLLIDDVKLIPVFAEIIKDLKAAPFADLCLVISRQQSDVRAPSTGERVWGLRRYIVNKKFRDTFLFRLYARWDDRRNPDISLFDEVTIDEMLAGIPTLEVTPIEKGFTDYFPQADIDRIKTENVDVLLRFGFRILRGDILSVAKCGIWSYHHGDQDFYRGSPPYFWEMIEGASMDGVILQILNEKLDNGRVLVKGHFAAEPGISVKKRRVGPYSGSQHFVIDQLRRLYSIGWEQFSDSLATTNPYLGKRQIYRSPTNTEMLTWIGQAIRKKINSGWNRQRTVSHWKIGIRHKNGNPLAQLTSDLAEKDFQWLNSPKGHFWADPFLYEYSGKSFLFFEDYSYDEGRAVIACGEINPDLQLTNVQTVLDTGTHASFPLVFEDGGNIYMVPETCEEGKVNLYRSVNFPNRWEKVRTLVDLPCVDTVLWKHEGRWWLHTSYNFQAGHAHTALLYSSATLLGEWELHPQAPFPPNARYARNAGPMITTSEGQLYRVSQSSEFSYGSSITFHKITRLDQQVFTEAIEQTVRPAPNSSIRGNHSYGANEKFEVVDAVSSVPLSLVN
jgi:hypothetical protein